MNKELSNGICIVKYKKVKSTNHGAKRCIEYVANPEKTMEGLLEEYSDVRYELDYVGNEEKVALGTGGRRLVSGWNCDAITAADSFEKKEKEYHKNRTEKLNEGHKANQAFHIIISYKGNDMDPEKIHEMGREFSRRLCGDEFMAITATHLNTNNYHNHIVVCAYANDGKHKFQDSKNIYQTFKDIANDISLENGLPILTKDDEKERVSRKERERRKEVTARVRELQIKYPDRTKYREVYISAYDEFGRHRSNFERMLLTVKEMMKQGSEAAYWDAFRELDGENIFFRPLSEKAKMIDQAIEICRTNDIGNMDELNERLRQLHAENSPYKQRIQSLTTYIDNIKRYGDKALKMTDAQLNPMQPKTKSDLYRALHGTEYRLLVPYTKISEDKAKEIINIIRSDVKDNLPVELKYGNGFVNASTVEPIPRTREKMDAVLKEKQAELESVLKEQEPVKKRIAELYIVKQNMEKYIRPEFVFGPLYAGNTMPLEKAKKEILSEKWAQNVSERGREVVQKQYSSRT